MKRQAMLLAALFALSVLCAASAADAIYPTDIAEYTDGEHSRIEKSYALSGTDDPSLIPTDDIEREGCVYTLLDMTRQDMAQTDSHIHTETVSVESTSNRMDDILMLLDETIEVETEDGYAGVLTLDSKSIETTASGYGTSMRELSATRSYPSLSDADTALIPKTVDEGGRTLALADVQWQEAGDYYNATATYSGKVTNRYATGYTVTAEYSGEVTKTVSDKVVYTAIFGRVSPAGSSDVYQVEQSGDSAEGGIKWVVPVMIVIGVAALGAVVVLLWRIARRGARRYTR